MRFMKKIGILGGTLDPIHNGHMSMAKCAREQLSLDKIIIMPTPNPPHKNAKNISDANIRLFMVKIAIENIDYLEYSDFEMKREGIIYTSDTLELFIKENPDSEIFFIMGADSLLAIETWHKPEKIFEQCKVVVVDRDNSDEKINKQISYLQDKYDAQIIYLNMPMVDISSTNIKKRIKNNESINNLVPKKVEKYILQNKLYK